MTQRNPYVILGIEFGASRTDANVAFARKAGPLRRLRDEESRNRLTELTYALNQIDEALDDPETALDVYRVPAEPGAYTIKPSGIFAPLVERLPGRRTGRDAALAYLRQAASREYLHHLVTVHASGLGLPDA